MYEVAEIQDAQVLAPLLGTKWAPILFGSIDQLQDKADITRWPNHGYLNLRIQPWVRRIITRLIAIPAVVVISIFGEG
jgi:manganese transport protein